MVEFWLKVMQNWMSVRLSKHTQESRAAIDTKSLPSAAVVS